MADPDPPDQAIALADRLFGEEPETLPGHWYIGNSGGWQWAPDPEDA